MWEWIGVGCGGSEGPWGLIRSEKVCEIRGGQMVECFVGEDQNFVVDAMGDRKPVEVFEDWGDVMP